MLNILYEDNHLIAINKPACILVQGDKTGDVSLDKMVKDLLKTKYNKPGNVFLGVTHRLDRPASGVVLFAKTSKALSRINEIFRSGDIDKTYLAIVRNKPNHDRNTLINTLAKNHKLNKSFVLKDNNKKGKEAKLKYRMIDHSESFYLLQVNIYTGRHHQIRCQLANIDCPIKGDLKYGSLRSNIDGSIDLHACKLSFTHPVKKTSIEITAHPPDSKQWKIFNINNILKTLRPL